MMRVAYVCVFHCSSGKIYLSMTKLCGVGQPLIRENSTNNDADLATTKILNLIARNFEKIAVSLCPFAEF
jgi:hypothetical protein